MNLIKIDGDFVKSRIKPRPSNMHKGQAGHVLIIAGSRGMAGAAVLAAKGALRSGSGIVKVCVPNDLIDILQISVPEAMCIDRNELSYLDLSQFHTIAIGPGLGVSSDNYFMIIDVLRRYDGRVIIDADGLNCLSKYGLQPLQERGNVIITPHPGEAARLLSKPYDPEKRMEFAIDLAKATNAVTLLKGEKTLVTDGDLIYENSTGNPGMATGGSGDVLTGVIAALSASVYLDLSELEATALGAYIHGLAGDEAAKKYGQVSMTSKDIADSLFKAFCTLT